MFSKSTVLKVGINTLIGVVAIAAWLQFVDIKTILISLKEANFIWLIPAFGMMWISFAIRAYKLKFFLNQIENIAFSDLLSLTGIATLLNFFIPIRAGEVVKSLYLGKTYSISTSKILVWVFLDRFLDFLILLILVPILLIFIPTNLPANFVIITFVICLSFAAVSYLMVYQKSFSEALFKLVTLLLVFRLPRKHLTRLYLHFLDTFQILRRSPADLLVLFSLAVLAYVADAAILYFCFLSINSSQNMLNIFLGQLISALTYLIPAAPGFVGSAEASGLIVFSGILGISPNISSAMIVLFHGATAVFVAVYGLVCIYIMKIDISSLFKKALGR